MSGEELRWLIQNQGYILSTTPRSTWVRFYISQILCALETINKFNIVYRDLKPENIMIAANGLIKLIDFGFAKILSQASKFRTYTTCGSVGYISPEILLGMGYSFETDIWSLGILICEMYSIGLLPFCNSDNPLRVMEQTVKGQIKMPHNLDPAAKDLIKQLLLVDVDQRLSINKIMKSSFFNETQWDLVRQGLIQDKAPYIPQQGKYNYLFHNNHPETAMIDTRYLNSRKQPKTKILGDFSYTKIHQEIAEF